MTFEENENSKDELWRRFHHHQNDSSKDVSKFFYVRQWLNVFFLVLSILGMVIWYAYSPHKGGITLIVAVAFKFSELTLRLMKM